MRNRDIRSIRIAWFIGFIIFLSPIFGCIYGKSSDLDTQVILTTGNGAIIKMSSEFDGQAMDIINKVG